MLHQCAFGTRQPGKIRRIGQRLHRGVEVAVLAQFDRVLGQLFLGRPVDGAQGLGVGHRVQVGDRCPRARKTLFQPLLGQHDGMKIPRCVGFGQRIDGDAIVGQQFVHRRHHVLGANG